MRRVVIRYRWRAALATERVNIPGTWSAIYPPLEHAPWQGWTPTDLIFPFFLFIVGITTELSLDRLAADGAGDRAIRLQILRRGALIDASLLFAVSFVVLWYLILPLFERGGTSQDVRVSLGLERHRVQCHQLPV